MTRSNAPGGGNDRVGRGGTDQPVAKNKGTSDEDREIMAIARQGADPGPRRFGGPGVPGEKSADFGAFHIRPSARLRIRCSMLATASFVVISRVSSSPRDR